MMSSKHMQKLISTTRLFSPRIIRPFSNSPSLIDVNVNEKTGIAIVSMNRAPVNGMNLELLTSLKDTLDALESNKSRGMILTSNMPTVFSGGLDITEFLNPGTERIKQFWVALQDCWLKLYGSQYPTVAAINGHSPAGGCLLAMSCEYRVMVQGKYTIGLNETALGISAPEFFQNTMRNTISSRETELALVLGKLYSVEDALRINLIDEIATDKEDAIRRSEMWIGNFAKINPMARSITKLTFRGNAIRHLEETRDEDLQRFLMAIGLPAVQKGLHAYIEGLKKKGSK